MKSIRVLLWITIAALIGISAAIYAFSQQKLPEATTIDTTGQPTIGYPKAKVHVIVFLDPKCADSKSYNNRIYPMIKEKYIDTNKILYTVIPVAFIPDSTPAAVALLCVYNQDPKYPNAELFMKYLNYLYEHQPPEHTDWTTTPTLVNFAKNASPAIDIANIESCTEKQKFRHQIAENTAYEEELIGHPQAPVLFIDGMRLDQATSKNVNRLMKAAFLEKGVTP